MPISLSNDATTNRLSRISFTENPKGHYTDIIFTTVRKSKGNILQNGSIIFNTTSTTIERFPQLKNSQMIIVADTDRIVSDIPYNIPSPVRCWYSPASSLCLYGNSNDVIRKDPTQQLLLNLRRNRIYVSKHITKQSMRNRIVKVAPYFKDRFSRFSSMEDCTLLPSMILRHPAFIRKTFDKNIGPIFHCQKSTWFMNALGRNDQLVTTRIEFGNSNLKNEQSLHLLLKRVGIIS